MTTYLNEKDILITRTGGTTGKTTLIQEIKETSIFASYLIRLSVAEDYNPEYIYLFLNSYLFWNQILDLKNGTAQPNVNANKMTTIIFPSCPREIQDKIVEYKKDKTVQISVLKQVQSDFQKINVSHKNLKSIIIENEKQSDIIFQLKQAILQEAISGQLTAEWRKQNPIQKGDPDTDAAALIAKIKAEKQQLIADGKLRKEKPLPEISPNEIPFSLPDSWVWCRLGEIALNRDDNRQPISRDERLNKEKIFPYYGASGIIDKIDGFTHEGINLLIGEDGANLISRSTPIAFVADGQYWVNNHAHVIGFTDIK